MRAPDEQSGEGASTPPGTVPTAGSSWTCEVLQRCFVANRRLFETIEVAVAEIDEHGDAAALCAALRSGERAFPVAVPPQPEVLDVPAQRGYLGIVTRGDLPPELAEPLFADGAGEIVGPVRYAGRTWVCRILLPRRPLLDASVLTLCEALLAEEARGASPGT